MKIGVVELAVDFSSLDLAEGDLSLDEVDNHQEVLAFLGMGTTVVVCDSDNGVVVLHER